MDLDYLIESALQKEYEDFKKNYNTREKTITAYILKVMKEKKHDGRMQKLAFH